MGEGEISSKGIRLIYKRCGLDSLEAAESLVAERPADLPPVGVVESKGLAVILERSGVETTSRLVVEDTWSPTTMLWRRHMNALGPRRLPGGASRFSEIVSKGLS